MIITVKTKVAQVRVKLPGGKLLTFQGTLVAQKDNAAIFEYNLTKGICRVIAHRNDIAAIRLSTWDNINKKTGQKVVSLAEYQQHIKNCN